MTICCFKGSGDDFSMQGT